MEAQTACQALDSTLFTGSYNATGDWEELIFNLGKVVIFACDKKLRNF